MYQKPHAVRDGHTAATLRGQGLRRALQQDQDWGVRADLAHQVLEGAGGVPEEDGDSRGRLLIVQKGAHVLGTTAAKQLNSLQIITVNQAQYRCSPTNINGHLFRPGAWRAPPVLKGIFIIFLGCRFLCLSSFLPALAALAALAALLPARPAVTPALNPAKMSPKNSCEGSTSLIRQQLPVVTSARSRARIQRSLEIISEDVLLIDLQQQHLNQFQ